MNILLDYFFPVTAIEPTPQASTAFLKQVCIVVKPDDGVTPGTPTLCTTAGQIVALTENLDAVELLNAGMSRIYVLPVATLDLATILATHGNKFYTLLISSDFNDTDVGGMALGTYEGVVGISSTSNVLLAAQAIIPKRVAFHTTSGTKAKNMAFAFGKLLSNALNWYNQQYIVMPHTDDVDTLGEANSLFDDKISFSISDTEFGQRLGLFAAGQKAIAAPYIIKNLEVDIQSAGLTYVSGNMPGYTKTQGALLEDELQKVVDSYIERQWIEAGKVEVKLEQNNFVASAYIDVAEPKALWRILAEMKQTL